MAILKCGGSYGAHDICIDLGDDDLNEEMKDRLTVSRKEVVRAIVIENLSDRIVARIFKERDEQHQQLMAKLPKVD